MIANPSAQFRRPKKHVSLQAKVLPYERRNICVLPASIAAGRDRRFNVVTKCQGGNHTHFTRAKVVQAVMDGEMEWLDKFKNTAGFTESAAKTWMPMASDGFTVMQMVPGGAMF